MKNKMILEEYLALKCQTCQQSTIDSIRSTINQFLQYLPDEDSLELSKKERRYYLEKLYYKVSAATFYNKVNQIRDFYSFCVLHTYVSVNPFETISIKYQYKPSFDILYGEELLYFLDCVDKDRKLLFPDCFLLQMFIATLGRVKEILDLRVHRVLFEEGRLFFITLEQQFMMSNGYIQKHWEDYLSYRDYRLFEGNQSHDYLLVTEEGRRMSSYHVNRVFEDVSDRYRLSLTPSKLRRSLIAYLMDEGVDYRTLQALVRHKNVHSIAVYDRFKFKEKKETIERYLWRGNKKE